MATVSITPFQLHALVMSVFASLIAPFGGFFASGLKRAFKLKVQRLVFCSSFSLLFNKGFR